MISSQITRFFHVQWPQLYSISKSNLAKLRKNTGYTFTNCKKALEVNDNDVTQAEKWLREQAQALGWAKATKLKGRTTTQGLVSIAVDGHTGVMVEVNCETDFVARNKAFHRLVELVAATCLQQAPSHLLPDQSHTKVLLGGQELQAMAGPEEKTLADHVALVIADVGENLSLRRALCVSVAEGLRLAAYTHPLPITTVIPAAKAEAQCGKYGALIVYAAANHSDSTAEVGRQLCQHVIGMDPLSLGSVTREEESTVKDEGSAVPVEETAIRKEGAIKYEDSAVLVEENFTREEGAVRYEDSAIPGEENVAREEGAECCNAVSKEEETAMLNQEFLLEPEVKVSDVVNEAGITLIDFMRYECGEPLEEEQPALQQAIN